MTPSGYQDFLPACCPRNGRAPHGLNLWEQGWNNQPSVKRTHTMQMVSVSTGPTCRCSFEFCSFNRTQGATLFIHSSTLWETHNVADLLLFWTFLLNIGQKNEQILKIYIWYIWTITTYYNVFVLGTKSVVPNPCGLLPSVNCKRKIIIPFHTFHITAKVVETHDGNQCITST